MNILDKDEIARLTLNNKRLKKENERLKEGLNKIMKDIDKNGNDTVWVGGCETLFDRIDDLLK